MKTKPTKIIRQLSVLVWQHFRASLGLTLTALLFLAGAATASAQTQTLYATPSTPTWRDNYNGGSACLFTVGPTNVVVSHLGYFQSNAVSSASIIAGGGLNLSHYVGIYSATSPVHLLAQVIVPTGAVADYFTNQFCWMPLDPPFVLSSNTSYYVAALTYNNDGDLWGDSFSATFNPYFVGGGITTNMTAYGPGGTVWPIPSFSLFGSNTTYCVEGLANLAVDQARVVVPGTNIAVLTGGTITVVGYATGQQPINYQWYQPGSPPTPMPGQTSSTLSIPNATAGNFTYYLTASNTLGGEQSANVHVFVSSTPVAVQQDLPTAITNFANYPITLSCMVTGSPPIFLEWFSNNVPNPGTIVLDSASFTLASSYSLFAAYPANNGNQYKVLASNYIGSALYATSSVANVTVLPNLAYPQNFLHGPPPTNVFNSNGGTGSPGNGQCGGRFVVGNMPVVVTHLGYNAEWLIMNGQAALASDHNVTLYSAGGAVLGNVVVTNGTPTNNAINGYLWAPLNPPLVLSNNATYILAAVTYAGLDPWGDTYGVLDWGSYFTPGGSPNAALYGNTWPTAPSLGGYGSQMYSAPNLAILTNVSAVYVSNTPVASPNYIGFASSVSNVLGSSLALIGTAEGQPPLYYPQWYFNGAPLASQTNATLVIASLASGNGGSYYLVVSNYQTSLTVTSAVTAVTILTNPMIVGQFPVTYTNISNTNLMSLYAGANPTFSVSVIGATPFHYQWFSNGVAGASATNASYQLANAQPTGATNFYCIITNIYGSATSAVWSASVLADPAGAPGYAYAPYPQSVLALNPIGYWRLNEPDDGLNDGNPGAISYDYAGGNDGIYTNVALGQTGYNPTSDPSDSSAGIGLSTSTDSDANSVEGINFGSPAGTSKAFTVEAWVNGYTTGTDAGIVTLGYGGAEQFDLDTGADPGHNFRFFIRDAAGNTHLVGSTIAPSIGTWHHLVGVVDEISSQTVTFYIDGQSVGSVAATNGIGILASAIPMSIGSRMGGQNTDFNFQFAGYLNDVAVYNTALSSNQVANQYLEGGQVPPYCTVASAPPATAVAAQGSTLTIPGTVYGSPVLGYQWTDLNTSAVLASGVAAANGTSVNAGFSTNNAQLSWNGDTFQLTVTNAYGTTNISVVVTVTQSPIIVTDLPPQVVVGQGQTYNYSIGAIGLPTLAYQWYEGAAAVFGATNVTFTPPTGVGGTNGIFVIVTNNYGSATSSISSFIVLPLPHTALATAISGLHPVGYWPMHETTLPAAPGDIETNYGIAGPAETGYYPDWLGTSGSSAFQHGFPTALANLNDSSETAVCFNTNSPGAGAATNALYVPNATKGAVLNPPFSVECWFFASNTAAGDLWSQSGYEGMNAGNAGGGAGAVCGIRLNVGGNYNIYTYHSNAIFDVPLNSVGTVVATNWYHVVVTCDASTNMSLYTNGIQCGTSTPCAGLYYPDYWTPLEVGSGKGNVGTVSKSSVAVEELAIYTNKLSAAQVLADYQAGTNVNDATSYFATITNNNPWVYYRMDSPPYSVPDPSTLPVLYNYGSVIGNGVYSPGTMPGVLPGPNTTYTGETNQGANVALLEGVSSFGDAGYSPILDPSAKYGTGSNAFSVVAMFRGNPANNTFQCMFGHSDNSWRMTLGANAAGGGAQGSVQFTYGGNTTASSTINCNDGKWHQVVGVYQPGPSASPGSDTLYIDGQFNTVNTTVSSNGIPAGSALHVLLGAAPDYTNNSPGLGRQFNGELCDVAVFTNALTAAQAQALYLAAGGVQQTLAMPYNGQLPVTWKYLGSNLGNNLGATNLMTLYAGASPSFMVTVSGAPVNSYQWFTNGAAVGFGTNAILTLPNVQTAFTTYCVATNNNNSATSVVWSASVAADPDASGSFSKTILSDNPMAYWRLNEAAGSAIAIDYAGGANGLYGSQTTNGQPGVPIVAATPELSVAMNISAANNINGTVTNAGIVLFTNNITFVVWQLPTGAEAAYRGTFVNRSTANFSGAGLCGSTPLTWGAYWNNSSLTYGYNSGLVVPPANQWFMGVVEIFPQYYVMATFTNTSAGFVVSSYVTNSTAPMSLEPFYGGNEIGCDNGTASGRVWSGQMNELAIFNYDLSPAQLNALYFASTNGALTAPVIPTQPQNITTVVGTAKTNFTVGASSFLQPLTYQWYYTNSAGATALANGLQANGSWDTNVTTTQLNITNVTFGAAGYYFVAVGNSAGANNSAIASLTVTPVTTRTNIVASLLGGTNLVLSWPANWTGWRLLAQTDSLSAGLQSTNWVTITGSAGTNRVAIPVCPTNGNVFYQLVYP